jgi:hypothetical protein
VLVREPMSLVLRDSVSRPVAQHAATG